MVPTNNGLTFRVETPATFRMDRPTGSLNPSGMDFLMAIQAERFVRMATCPVLLVPAPHPGALNAASPAAAESIDNPA